MNETIWVCTGCRALLIQGEQPAKPLHNPRRYDMKCPICGCAFAVKTQGC